MADLDLYCGLFSTGFMFSCYFRHQCKKLRVHSLGPKAFDWQRIADTPVVS